ncbi:MAG: S41 family peptidase [Bacteroidaceae bacterium]|nr:S41 family peptidase [Bacteroidaceae bacterium]
MKRFYFLISLMLCASVLSCQKDSVETDTADDEEAKKEAEYQARLKANRYVMKQYHDQLFSYYFWYDDVLSAVNKLDYQSFTTVDKYFDATLHSSDRWSWMADADYYISMITGVSEKSYGVSLSQPIDHYNDYSIIVSMIYPESPLAKHGVSRGWKLTHLGGVPVMDIVADNRFNREWSKDNQEMTFVDLNGETHTFVESPAESLNENPCLISKVFGPEDFPGLTKKVGYLHYTSFVAQFNNCIDSIMQSFHDEGVGEMIVDLRYNGGGDVSALNVLAGYLAPKSANGQVLQRTIHNTALSFYDKKEMIAVPEKSLELDRLFVIISESSASSSECLINGLRPYMEVNLVGRQSYGKPNGMYVLLYPCSDEDYERYEKDDYSKLLYIFLPIAFFNKNSLNQSIPNDGFVPDNDRPDDLYHDFGVDEDNIRACLEKIVNGEYPELPKPMYVSSRSVVGSYVLPSPMDDNPFYGNILKPMPKELRKRFNNE